MTEDLGQEGAHLTRTSGNPGNPSAALLAEAYETHSASYDLHTGMIDDFLEGNREKPPPRRKPAKKILPAAEKAAARAARRAAVEAEAEATNCRRRNVCAPEVPPRAEDYFGYESAWSKAASIVNKEHSIDENSEEEYSQDGFLYHRDNVNRHGHTTAKSTSPSTPTTRRKDRRSLTMCHHYLARRRKRMPTTSSRVPTN